MARGVNGGRTVNEWHCILGEWHVNSGLIVGEWRVNGGSMRGGSTGELLVHGG